MSTADDTSSGDRSPLKAAEVRSLFADLANHPVLVLAVSGGPDSTALLVLAARWRKSLRRGPKLIAVTVDHRLRPQSANEAASVGRLARSLGVPHRTLRWTGRKPATGLQEAARMARYRLLAGAARRAGSGHVLTAHTLDDQAETVLIRLTRGSGLGGLAAMARVARLPVEESRIARLPVRESRIARLPAGELRVSLAAVGRDDIALVRPLLEVPKARLIATLRRAGIAYADDPTNLDPRFARVRMRAMMPALAREGLVPRRLALLASRARRAEAALESAVAEAAEQIAPGPWPDRGPIAFSAGRYAELPAEIALRLLGRAIGRVGNEGPVELGKLERLYADLTASRGGVRFRRTLAGALITRTPDRLTVERAPARRGTASKRP